MSEEILDQEKQHPLAMAIFPGRVMVAANPLSPQGGMET